MSFQKTKVDAALGIKVQAYLESIGLATPTTELLSADASTKIAKIEHHLTEAWKTLGMDLTDDSLADTPKRIAKMMVLENYWGLLPENFPKCTTITNKMNFDEMVLERNVAVMSNCEHHGVVIDGVAHVAYMPGDKVLGLSKLNRVVEYFSKRPQVQERLTAQIYHALSFILGTENVAVVIDATHYCVRSRGVEDINSSTVTSKLGGVFKADPATRAEFMNMISSVARR
jgi:GTP cyclohydrolase I